MSAEDALPQWRAMDDETRAVAYSPSSMLDGPLDPYLVAYAENSRRAYERCPHMQVLRYGPGEANTIDVVVPDADAPVPMLVFIHGGYWQALSKTDAFFPAPDALSRGIAYAAVDYTLAPDAPLEQIIGECRRAIEYLIEKAGDLNIDPARIILSGSSAGAHLAAMCCLSLPVPKRPAGAVLISGIFELEPLVGTYVNDPLGLDAEAAHRNSPALADLAGFPPALIAWGGIETDEFKRQSRYFAGLLRAAGGEAECLEMETRNHFDIVEDLANDSALGRKTALLVTG